MPLLSPTQASKGKVSSEAYRQPSNWNFCKLLREVREKRSLTAKQAAQGLPGVSDSKYQAWETGTRQPSNFVQTLVIWRLNTGAIKSDDASAPRRRSRLLIPELPILMILAVATVATVWSQRERPAKAPQTLGAMVAHSASKAQGQPISVEACEAYAARLAETLTQLNEQERGSVFGKRSDLAESVLD